MFHERSLADFFIEKPGPGSISGALARHLPVIVEVHYFTINDAFHANHS
jgi:hypothetical protein